MPGDNQFAIATPDTTFRYLCPDQRPRTGSLPSGVYLITIGQGCALDGNLWRLTGKMHRTYYATIPESAPKPVNVTITIPAQSLVLPDHLAILEIDKVQKLSQPDSPHIKASIFNLHSRLSNDQDFWQWVILTLIILTAIFITYRKYRAQIKCPLPIHKPKPQPPNYSQDNPIHYIADTSTVRLYPELTPMSHPTAPDMSETNQMTQTDPEE